MERSRVRIALNRSKSFQLAICLSAFVGSVSFADSGTTVMPVEGVGQVRGGSVATQFDPHGFTGFTKLNIFWHASCFGTNVRSVPNPLSPASTLAMDIQVSGMSLTVRCPARITAPGGAGSNNCTITAPSSATLKPTVTNVGNDVQVSLQLTNPSIVQPDGSYVAGPTPVTNLSFRQEVPPYATTEAYPPKNGPVGSVTSHTVSPDNTTIRIFTQFPGTGGTIGGTSGGNGFCGSYFSPLMLFFDDARPNFRGKSKFPLMPGKTIYWVERNAPGYFLAIDTEGDRSITRADQLFGNNDEHGSGFKALAEYDADHRKVIDSKSPIWPKLVLWNDKNGDGISQPREVFTLDEMGVKSISLDYNAESIFHFGERAGAYGNSSFTFKPKKSKDLKKGSVVDIWFSAYLK